MQQKNKYLTIEERLKVLQMLEERRSYTATALHFGVSIISPYHKPHILMEAALVAWIVDRSQKSLVLDV